MRQPDKRLLDRLDEMEAYLESLRARGENVDLDIARIRGSRRTELAYPSGPEEKPKCR